MIRALCKKIKALAGQLRSRQPLKFLRIHLAKIIDVIGENLHAPLGAEAPLIVWFTA